MASILPVLCPANHKEELFTAIQNALAPHIKDIVRDLGSKGFLCSVCPPANSASSPPRTTRSHTHMDFIKILDSGLVMCRQLWPHCRPAPGSQLLQNRGQKRACRVQVRCRLGRRSVLLATVPARSLEGRTQPILLRSALQVITFIGFLFQNQECNAGLPGIARSMFEEEKKRGSRNWNLCRSRTIRDRESIIVETTYPAVKFI